MRGYELGERLGEMGLSEMGEPSSHTGLLRSFHNIFDIAFMASVKNSGSVVQAYN